MLRIDKTAIIPALLMLSPASRQKLGEGVGMAPFSIVWREAGSFEIAKLEQVEGLEFNDRQVRRECEVGEIRALEECIGR